MSGEKSPKNWFVIAMDVLIFAFAISELIEAIFHVGLDLVLPEAVLQIVTMILRGAAVWHAGRHL